MLSHAEIYANVIKARPECAASLVEAAQDGCGTYLVLDGVPCAEGDEGDSGTVLALAIITDHWTEMLPEYASLSRSNDNPGPRWYVDAVCCDGLWHVWPCADTRFHALAEFLVLGSTKENA